MGRAAPRWARISRAAHARQQNNCACRRSARPSVQGRVRRDETQTRAQTRVAGTKNTALFDIVELGKVREAGIALVSRPSEHQRAKSRDLGATRQNRWTASSRVALVSRLSFRSRKRSLHSAGTRDRGTRLICLERGRGKSASFVAMALL